MCVLRLWARLAPRLLAGVFGCVCACLRSPLVPRHSWLGCAVWVCVLGLGFQLRPATPGRGVWVCVCLCALSACTPALLAGLWDVGVCAWAWVSAAPRHSWPGCWGVCVLLCALRLYPATPGWGVRCGCVCLGSGFGCAPPLLAGVFGCVCVCVRSPLVPCHSWLGCAVWVRVLGLGFRLRPATPGWVVGVCVCLFARSACTPPLLAGVCGLGFSARARASAAPRHSWLGCWGVCVLGARSACAPPLLAGVCVVGVCVWARVLAAPRLSWLGCWGVRVCVRASLVPRHSWLGCAVWVCVLGLRFRLRRATPGWGVGVCVCLCARSTCSPTPPGWGVRRGCVCFGSGFGCALPYLAGVLGCVCACVRPPLVPRHSWLACAVWVCVLGLGFQLRPAGPGWGVGCVCVFVCLVRLYPAPPGWGARCGWLCLGSGFCCAQPLLAGVLGCVCVFVCLLRLYPATSGWAVRAWGRVSAAPRHSWLRCRGVCLLVCALRLYPDTPGWGLWCVGLVLRGTCPCAVVRCVLCVPPGFAAPGGRCCLAPVRVPWLWLAACLSEVPCGPELVRRTSSGPVALDAPVGFPDAVVPFPTLGACTPGFTGWLRGARGGRPRTGLGVPAAGPRRGWGAGLAPRCTRSEPLDEVTPGGSLRRQSWAACAAVVGVCGRGH